MAWDTAFVYCHECERKRVAQVKCQIAVGVSPGHDLVGEVTLE